MMHDLPHYHLLGMEFPVIREDRYYKLVDMLENRGLLGHVKYTNPVSGARRHLIINFPEKGRARFLRRHLGWLEMLKDAYDKDFA